jgi:purine-cytosine permease-like protein
VEGIWGTALLAAALLITYCGYRMVRVIMAARVRHENANDKG